MYEKAVKDNSKLNQIIENVKNRKIKNLQKKLDKLRGFRADVDDAELILDGFKKENLQKLGMQKIPESLDFKVPDHYILNLINEQRFRSIKALSESTEQKKALRLMIRQYFNFKDFAEKLNSLQIALFHIMKFKTLEDIMVNINRTMGAIFSAENIYL